MSLRIISRRLSVCIFDWVSLHLDIYKCSDSLQILICSLVIVSWFVLLLLFWPSFSPYLILSFFSTFFLVFLPSLLPSFLLNFLCQSHFLPCMFSPFFSFLVRDVSPSTPIRNAEKKKSNLLPYLAFLVFLIVPIILLIAIYWRCIHVYKTAGGAAMRLKDNEAVYQSEFGETHILYDRQIWFKRNENRFFWFHFISLHLIYFDRMLYYFILFHKKCEKTITSSNQNVLCTCIVLWSFYDNLCSIL